MKIGSANEYAVAKKLESLHYITEFYDVGLMQCIKHPFLGVSPDGVAKIDINGVEYYACVEIKTRVAEGTIDDAEEAVREYGSKVECIFGDAVFRKCVLASNRRQVLHQAYVTGLTVGIFVVSKVQDEKGQILQVVICKIPPAILDDHEKHLLKLAEPLLGWLYQEDVTNNGFVTANDTPNRMTVDQQNLVLSRTKLWLAFLRKITDEKGNINPPTPLQIIKHGAQGFYNGGKPGVDKTTEFEKLI